MRRKITNETWEQIETAYASGIGLREIPRNMGIPEGTVLARAKREGRGFDSRPRLKISLGFVEQRGFHSMHRFD